MRQTDVLPRSDKCYEPTVYLSQKRLGLNKTTFPVCIYLDHKNGRCTLNACVKNTKGVGA